MAKQKPTFEKSSAALVALFADLTPTAPGLVRKSMFGCKNAKTSTSAKAGRETRPTTKTSKKGQVKQ